MLAATPGVRVPLLCSAVDQRRCKWYASRSRVDDVKAARTRTVPGSGDRVRDAERTKARLLATARKEFAAKGFAGARVDVIAQRARVNKRMLYYYYKTKAGLFRAVLEKHAADRHPWVEAAPEDLGERLTTWLEGTFADPDWVRVLLWEGMDIRRGKVEMAEKRRLNFDLRVEQVRRDQAAGRLPSDLDPRHLTLALMMVSWAPIAFPSLTYIITGHFPTDKAFLERQRSFLRGLGREFRRTRALNDAAEEDDGVSQASTSATTRAR